MSEIVLRYAVMVLVAALAVILVLTGHEASQVTSILGTAFAFIVGVLFRDTLGAQRAIKAQENKDV